MTSDLKITLRQLHPSDEAVFVSSLELWPGEDLEWYSFILPKKPDIDFLEMLRLIEDEHKGVNLPDGWVPATMLYAFLEEGGVTKIVGRFHIRQRLTPHLLKRGGHVGYAVAPSYRGKGVATLMMEQGLDYIRDHFVGQGIDDKILITCADENNGSWKLIEKFGGVLENKIWDEVDDEPIRRYWLKL
ncbi:GNAT family N-acetyltransferase [bacterium]|nr:GNAT family N-acetyltransferase [bacterium]